MVQLNQMAIEIKIGNCQTELSEREGHSETRKEFQPQVFFWLVSPSFSLSKLNENISLATL